jgi:hypothetical protein
MSRQRLTICSFASARPTFDEIIILTRSYFERIVGQTSGEGS